MAGRDIQIEYWFPATYLEIGRNKFANTKYTKRNQVVGTHTNATDGWAHMQTGYSLSMYGGWHQRKTLVGLPEKNDKRYLDLDPTPWTTDMSVYFLLW